MVCFYGRKGLKWDIGISEAPFTFSPRTASATSFNQGLRAKVTIPTLASFLAAPHLQTFCRFRIIGWRKTTLSTAMKKTATENTK